MKRQAISPVIATLLLIVIAVASAVLAYIWIIGYQGTLTQQASTPQLQERIKIEAVEYDGTNLYAYVRNIGDIKVDIVTAYLINASGNVIASNLTISNLSLNPGDLDRVKIPNSPIESGKTYVVKVVTAKGTEATYTWTYRT